MPKLKAFRIKDTGDALLLANRRAIAEHPADPLIEVWVPRSVITHLRVWGLRPGQEGQPNMVHVDIESWFVRRTPSLDTFTEV